jgi:hypothetical protein
MKTYVPGVFIFDRVCLGWIDQHTGGSIINITCASTPGVGVVSKGRKAKCVVSMQRNGYSFMVKFRWIRNWVIWVFGSTRKRHRHTGMLGSIINSTWALTPGVGVVSNGWKATRPSCSANDRMASHTHSEQAVANSVRPLISNILTHSSSL